MTGWRVFPAEAAVRDWLASVAPAARATAEDPDLAHWHRHGGTWFAGVDALANDVEGRVGQGPPLHCAALDAAAALAGKLPLHPAQVSITYPGYPCRDGDETEAAHRYRLTRDAAHLDGLKPIGPKRRRMIREPHAWILGLPLDPMRTDTAPLVVWDGSEEILRQTMRSALAPHPPGTWQNVDVTEPYQAARRHIFETCTRVEIEAEPGQAILLHRLILHGVGPWPGKATTKATQRAVIYFRPVLPGGIADWLALP